MKYRANNSSAGPPHLTAAPVAVPARPPEVTEFAAKAHVDALEAVIEGLRSETNTLYVALKLKAHDH